MKCIEIEKGKPAEPAEKPAAERVDSVKPSTEPAEKPAAQPVDSVKPTAEPAETPAAEPVDSVKPTAEPAAEVPETILEPDPEAMAANEGEPTMQEAATQVSTAPDVSTIGTTPAANAKANVTAGSLSLSAEVCGGDMEMKVAANAGDTSVEASVRKTTPGKPDALDDLEMHLERMVDEAEELEQANQRARALEGLLQALLQQPAEMHQARSTYIRNMLRRPGTCDIEELAKNLTKEKAAPTEMLEGVVVHAAPTSAPERKESDVETPKPSAETAQESAGVRVETAKESPGARVETPKSSGARVETVKESASARVEPPESSPGARVETTKESAGARVETPESSGARVETTKESAGARVETTKESAGARVETPESSSGARVETPKESQTQVKQEIAVKQEPGTVSTAKPVTAKKSREEETEEERRAREAHNSYMRYYRSIRCLVCLLKH